MEINIPNMNLGSLNPRKLRGANQAFKRNGEKIESFTNDLGRVADQRGAGEVLTSVKQGIDGLLDAAVALNGTEQDRSSTDSQSVSVLDAKTSDGQVSFEADGFREGRPTQIRGEFTKDGESFEFSRQYDGYKVENKSTFLSFEERGNTVRVNRAAKAPILSNLGLHPTRAQDVVRTAGKWALAGVGAAVGGAAFYGLAQAMGYMNGAGAMAGAMLLLTGGTAGYNLGSTVMHAVANDTVSKPSPW